MPEQFFFSDLRELFAKANEEKSGAIGWRGSLRDQNGKGSRQSASSQTRRSMTFVRRPLIDPDDDSVSKLILESFDREGFMPIKSSTVGESVQRLSRSLENLHANTLGLFRGKLLVTMQVNHRRIEAPMSQLHLDSIWVRVSVSHMCSATMLQDLKIPA
jgi:ethanolamine ammonia-lyase large subunit